MDSEAPQVVPNLKKTWSFKTIKVLTQFIAGIPEGAL